MPVFAVADAAPGQTGPMSDQLDPFPDDWERGLAIVAHPDDLEYGAASAIAAWTAAGKEVSYALVTSGEAGIDGLDPAEAGPLREDEERASAAVVGVSSVEFLGHADGLVTYGLPLRRDLARVIRRHRPEVLITSNFDLSWPGGGLNMADHRHTGLAVIDAARDAGNRWVFTDLLDEGHEPWSGARRVAVNASPRATHAVDVTATIDLGVASLRAHAAYLAGLGDAATDPTAFLRTSAASAGERFGGRLAVTFELLSW
ncbi:MAG: LmbE family protein [Acidimicrobiales bacterium]|nr:LmbE family protein [Acidimicrobiales bacterium]